MTTPRPFYDLLHSRRFLLLVLGSIVSIVLYFGAKYAGPAYEDIKFLIGAIDALAIALITAITSQNNAQIKSTGSYKPPTGDPL